MLKKLFTAVLVLLLPALLLPETGKPARKTKSKKKTVSIIKFIPGIAQMKAGQTIKGGLLLGSFIGSVTGTVIHNHKGNQWYGKYSDSTNVEEVVRFRKVTENHLKKRNLFIIGIASTWLLHVLDLKLFKSDKAGITGAITNKTIDIGIYYAF
ncbi:MAG: hypothetical protein GY765_00650 [bacterium]|nr:hypothetical protein [bacterium]